jgi:hypothetical protein
MRWPPCVDVTCKGCHCWKLDQIAFKGIEKFADRDSPIAFSVAL